MLKFTDEELQHIKRFSRERRTFASPTILIVEDQPFSRTLLQGMLNKTHACYSAENAERALALYAEHVPCITFLDIELPGMSGHEIAAFLKENDPQSFIVMVTANNQESDVMIAHKNKVQGFIVKPYSRLSIMKAIDKYSQSKH